jgi:hypothetical protein
MDIANVGDSPDVFKWEIFGHFFYSAMKRKGSSRLE